MKPCSPKLGSWLRVCSLAGFWRQTWRHRTMPDMASSNPIPYSLVPCLVSFFDVMSGVGNLISCVHSATCPTIVKRAFIYDLCYLSNYNDNIYVSHLLQNFDRTIFLWKCSNARDPVTTCMRITFYWVIMGGLDIEISAQHVISAKCVMECLICRSWVGGCRYWIYIIVFSRQMLAEMITDVA